MTSIRKLLSIRIRRNRNFMKKSGGKTYKSLAQQLNHDLRAEDFEPGYLINEGCGGRDYLIASKGSTRAERVQNTLDRATKLWNKAKADYYEHNGRRIPKNTNEYLTGVLSFGRNFGHDLEPEQLKALTKALKEFVNERFGNVLSVAYHGTELSGHLHFSLVNYDFENHKTISNNVDTSKLQDEIAIWLQGRDLDFGYNRGVAKENNNNAKHLEIIQAKHEYEKELDQSIKEMTDQLKSKVQEMIELTGDSSWEKRLKTGIKYADYGQTERLRTLLDRLESVEIPTKPITGPASKPIF